MMMKEANCLCRLKTFAKVISAAIDRIAKLEKSFPLREQNVVELESEVRFLSNKPTDH